MIKEKLGYIPKEQRKKILLICDDVRAFSGIATVGREIIIETSHHFNFAVIGGSMKHPEEGKRLDLSQSTNEASGLTDSSVTLYPTSGYGNPDMLRQIIQIEKPDTIFLITDPRYFIWLFQMENEIRKEIPIVYLNIWDSPTPYPLWNKPYYESCDALLAISKQTYNINHQVLGDKAKDKIIKFVPHGLNEKVFCPLSKDNEELLTFKKQIFGGKEYDFVLLFNSRNIRRKQIPDTMLAYKLFIDNLPEAKAKRCAFVLHTQIVDEHGTDLEAVREYLLTGEKYNIIFSTQPLDPRGMNLLYNATDAQILLTDNEGWGLSLTEAILAGNPIIANVQGGMQDQMRFEDETGAWIDFTKDFPSNHRGTYQNHGEWAFPVFPSNISIQGSPLTPYISSDRCRPEDAADTIMEVYELSREERKRRGQAGRDFALSEGGFTSEKQGERIIDAIDELFRTWQPREKYELINSNTVPAKTIEHKLLY